MDEEFDSALKKATKEYLLKINELDKVVNEKVITLIKGAYIAGYTKRELDIIKKY